MMLIGKQLSNTYVFLFVFKFFLAEDFPTLILYIHMISHVLTIVSKNSSISVWDDDDDDDDDNDDDDDDDDDDE